MLPELGHFALLLALVLACLQSIFPLLGAWRQLPGYVALARPLAYAQGGFILFAFAALAWAFISNDFSVAYVAHNSNTQLPAIYRFCAVWGAHEGSMLLWVTVLALWMMAVARASHSLPPAMVARVLAVLSLISMGFLLFILFTSNPFLRLLPFAPGNGQDLNPLLQDPGLVSHPPMLYMGYVGFSVAFAFALAGLIGGRLDTAWIRWTRPWTLAAWGFLTVGITMGSWWSYHQLGWGGWWFWDPVENASFLPWLTGTALLHSLAVAEKRQLFKAWSVLLAILVFSLSLLGTFLVRSGVLVSVHAFAVDPSRGIYMLGFFTLVVAGSLSLYAWRVSQLKQSAGFALLSRESGLLINNVLLMVVMSTVLLGTLYPLVLQTLNIAKISVGEPYFNTVFVPLMLPMILLMGFTPHSRWQGDSWSRLWRKLWPIASLSLLVAIVLPWWLSGSWSWAVTLGVSVLAWLVLSSLFGLWQQFGSWQWSLLGMWVAHIGVAICGLGIIISGAYSSQREVVMTIGDTVQVGQYDFKFLRVGDLHGPNYTGTVGYFTVTKQGKPITRLAAERRVLNVGKILKTQAAIHPGLIHDLYLVLGNSTDGKNWQVRAYHKPLVRWIWLGGFLMLFGGLLAMVDRRYRRYQAKHKVAHTPTETHTC